MHALRSERLSAVLLLFAAAIGLVLANSPAAASVDAVASAHIGPAWLDLSIRHWIGDGLLAIFFFIVAVELKRELAIGELNRPAAALAPAVAALGGVLAPIAVFLAFTGGSPSMVGWPVPTATDIAFALGVLAIFGRYLPTRVRVFLLALAVLDDLIAIVLIALVFTHEVNLPALGLAVVTIGVFGLLSRMLRPRSPWLRARRPVWPIALLLIALGIAAWVFTVWSGVHPTLAGVGLGLTMARFPAGRAAHVLEPWSNALVLPLFACSAALVVIPQVGTAHIDPAFWGIVVALPVGKLIGIVAAGALVIRFTSHAGRTALTLGDLAVVGVLGGIGFTVSLLMNTLAFERSPALVAQGTLGVLIGSGVAIAASAVVVTLQSRHYRRLGATPGVGGALSR
ncbi:MAG TPA: Na+/H+ antiporter NhaA [Candidatus Lumbricidophila sp.]|nr:Na+/H+ antiporter NhaA [Candidatus Lumbricidophila sp.]